MKFGTEFDKLALRACGHRESYGFAYTNKNQRSEQELRAAYTVCTACKDSIRQLVSDTCGKPCQSEAVLTARLPELLGRGGQLNWASSLRLKACAFYFPVLEKVAPSSAQPETGIRNALRLLFSIQAASFWIDSRDELMSASWLLNEVEMLVRLGGYGTKAPTKASAHAYWKRFKPELLASAKRSLTAPAPAPLADAA